VTKADLLFDLFMAAFNSTDDPKLFRINVDNFNRMYKNASCSEQGEYHARVAKWGKQ
jgi:hypothetical protein